MADKKQNTYKIPGVSNADRVPSGTQIALFVRGFDAYKDARGTILVVGDEGRERPARIVGSEVGRLFSLAARFMGQSVQSQTTYPGSGAGDVVFFDSLSDSYGADGIGPLEPYTVLVLVFDPQIV